MLTKEVKQLLIDSDAGYQETMEYVSSVMPDLKTRVSLYREDSTLFDAYGVERALKEAAQRAKFGSSVEGILSSSRLKPWSRLMLTPVDSLESLTQITRFSVLTLRLLRKSSAKFNCEI